MNHMIKFTSVLLAFCFSMAALYGQSAISAAGGSASGTGGTVTYTVGQVTYNTFTGSSGSVAHGVQHPWEISIVTAIETSEDITLEMSVYPNPTQGVLNLAIRNIDDKNLRYRLYDMNGLLLQDKKIEDKETVISMDNLPSSVYFLKIIRNKTELKVFKVVKN